LTRDDLVRGYRIYFGGSELLAKNEAEQIMKRADLDGNGEIGFSEWCIATRDRTKAFSDEKLKAAFDFFDKKGTGTINREGFSEVMKDKQDVDEEMWDIIIQEVDEDGDGELNFEEFKRMMHRLVEY
jgi:calcium-dependent protein kinase